MPTRVLLILLMIVLVTACAANPPGTPTPAAVASPTSISTATLAPTPTLESPPTPTAEPDVSYKVAAFYYPWYGNPDIDGKWVHWTQNNHLPPEDISSDYYPMLGAYSSNDRSVVAQHMEWLRQAGVGVIISSWWGQDSREDRAVPLLLEIAERYGIKVAFHIEPYNGRTAESIVSDVEYLYEQYGASPAFFRSNATSRYSQDEKSKGMFFVWSIARTGEGTELPTNYWQQASDQIHALPEGALIIAHSKDAAWIGDSHFDGLYNYTTLHLEESGGFDWARSLPPDTLYIPSVLPGFSARRVGYPERTFVDRQDGKTYNDQWTSALGTGIQPEMVTITSFNEWHEGSIIEPPAIGVNDGKGYTYADFGALPPEGYLELTREWVDKYLATTWSSTEQRARIRIATTSDWTTLDLVSAGAWVRPELVDASPSVAKAGMEDGDRFVLTQSLADATAGNEVAMTWDIFLSGMLPNEDLVLQIERGNIGKTQVTIYSYPGSSPVEIQTFEWDQVTSGRNSYQIRIPYDQLVGTHP